MLDGRAVLDGKAVIVTGGANGLGRAVGLALAAAGAAVIAVDLDAAGLDQVRRESAGQVAGLQADVSDDAAMRGVVDACLAEHGRVDVVINNAGIGQALLSGGRGEDVKFWDVAPDVFQRFLSVDTLGGFFLSRAAVPHMLAQGWGRIATVTTDLSNMIRVGRVPYGPAKAASEALTAIMSRDLGGTGVTANVLIPGGPARTNMVSQRPRSSELLEPAVMEPPALWLASAESDGVAGRRFLASRRDPGQPAGRAAAAAGGPIAWASGTSRVG
jgi:NAD(P)-dependent dehydrogenase (short-subunit alcohol dehydrogenase family)